MINIDVPSERLFNQQQNVFTVLRKSLFYRLLSIALIFSSFTLLDKAQAQSDMAVFSDSLASGWENWSWTTVNFSNTSPVRAGSRSISVAGGAWSAIYLHHASFDASSYSHLNFYIHGGSSGNQRLTVQATINGNPGTEVDIGPIAANSWTLVKISLDALGVGGQSIDGFWIADSTGTTQPTYFLDDVSLLSFTGPTPTPVPNQSIAVDIDALANRHSIPAGIYGVAFGDSNLSDLNVKLNRSGGNAQTRYNWQLNASNRGSDWYFESIGGTSTIADDSDTFVRLTKAAGAEPMLTVPMIGWVAKLGANRSKLASFSIAKYGSQDDADWSWFPDAGNGMRNGNPISGNDPNDANMPANVSFQDGFIKHNISTFGNAQANGVRYYILDNEPGLWDSTHRDVHPTGATMRELTDGSIAYAKMIKSNDSNAAVMGPEEWGWTNYFLSGYDTAWASTHGWGGPYPDQQANGGRTMMEDYLIGFNQASAVAGKRLLDIFTLHYYPQGGEFSNDTSNAMQLRRNRSTRSLWDANYTDETWISDRVKLIPRMKDWVNSHYPGTKIGITEYNWGAENHINGATAQADVYGIFGREGVDIGARWTTPDPSTPTYKAMKMYTNYDGNKSTFGDISVKATVPQPDNLSAFAAVRASDNALTVMVINKVLTGSTPVSLNLQNFSAGQNAVVYQLTKTNAINRLADISVQNSVVSFTAPSQSITLLVIADSGSPVSTATPTATFTATSTSTPTRTAAPTNTFTATPTRTSTPTVTSTRTATPTVTFTATPTRTATPTPTNTGLFTNTPTPTQTSTRTATPTVTSTATPTPTVTSTATQTPTPTSTTQFTSTPTPTATSTPTQGPSCDIFISRQPQNVAVPRNSSATFSVVASGSGSLRFQWFRNGKTMRGETATSLTVSADRKNVRSFFEVEISNSSCKVRSEKAYLYIGATMQVQGSVASLTTGDLSELTIEGTSNKSPKVFTTKTDKSGKFKLTLPKGKKFSLSVKGTEISRTFNVLRTLKAAGNSLKVQL